uniref:Uncharacterized protein n=1 Tax=Cacopsylla melanoneura TaxID=428564 RepID=A0A8D8Y6G9_9HEMI
MLERKLAVFYISLLFEGFSSRDDFFYTKCFLGDYKLHLAYFYVPFLIIHASPFLGHHFNTQNIFYVLHRTIQSHFLYKISSVGPSLLPTSASSALRFPR